MFLPVETGASIAERTKVGNNGHRAAGRGQGQVPRHGKILPRVAPALIGISAHDKEASRGAGISGEPQGVLAEGLPEEAVSVEGFPEGAIWAEELPEGAVWAVEAPLLVPAARSDKNKSLKKGSLDFFRERGIEGSFSRFQWNQVCFRLIKFFPVGEPPGQDGLQCSVLLPVVQRGIDLH